MRMFEMKSRRAAVALAVLGLCGATAMAQDQHAHAKETAKAAADQDNALVKAVRAATEKYKDVRVAEAD